MNLYYWLRCVLGFHVVPDGFNAERCIWYPCARCHELVPGGFARGRP